MLFRIIIIHLSYPLRNRTAIEIIIENIIPAVQNDQRGNSWRTNPHRYEKKNSEPKINHSPRFQQKKDSGGKPKSL